MAQIIINTGNVANDGTGEPLRNAFNDVNNNFTQVFNAGPVNSNIRIANNTIQTTNTNGNLVLATTGIGVIVPATNFVPDIANVRMVGASTKRFNTVYTQYLDALSSTISGNLNVQGNLQVTGNIVTVNYSTANIANLTMTLAGNAGAPSLANGAGILVHSSTARLIYNYSGNSWNSSIAMRAPAFIGDGSQLTNVTANTFAQNLQGNTVNPNVIYSNLTTFGTVASIQASGDISTTGNVYANIITGTIVTANVLAGDGGNISNITASAIVGNVTSAVNAQNALTANLAALATQSINADTALFALNAGIADTANTATSALTANAASYAVQSDNANSAVVAGMALELASTANISITGNITVGGILTDGYYYANGAPFSGGGIGNYGNANVAAYLPTYSGNLNADVVTANVATIVTVNTTSLSTTDATIYGLTAVNDINATGTITGNLTGTTTGTHNGLVYDIDIRYMVWDFGFVPPRTYNNPIQYLLDKTGNIDMGTITAPADLNIDTGYF